MKAPIIIKNQKIGWSLLSTFVEKSNDIITFNVSSIILD